MLENDHLFTPDMKIKLARSLGLPHTPEMIAEDADIFVRAQTPPEKLEKRSYEMPVGMEHILGKRLFMKEFIEKHFAEDEDADMRHQARSFVSDFYDWRDSTVEEFKSRDSVCAQISANTVSALTLSTLHEFIGNQVEKFKLHRSDSRQNIARYHDAKDKLHRWERYQKVAHFAVILDGTLPHVKT